MKHLTALKRVVSAVLVVCMLIGTLSTSVFADSNVRIIKAQKISGLSRPVNTTTQKVAKNVPLYSDDEMVTVIVQLESPAVIDYYNGGVSTFSAVGARKESVSDFLTSSTADGITRELLSEQRSVVNAISSIPSAPANGIATIALQPVEVLMQYTGLVNAMAIRVPYGKLDEIRKLDGVKRAYVQHTYDAPAPADDIEFGNEGYSYSMVNVADAWKAGYTGTGMVVAVLDTGLDLSHQAFTADSFRRANPESDVKFDEAGMAQHLAGIEDYMMAPILYSGDMSDTYKSLKVPYAFDYAAKTDASGALIGGDTDVFPGLSGSDHGTHVSGTIAGYAVTDEGEVEFSGIAPDAQLMMLKVFNDAGSMTDEMMLIAALNDAIVLGADVINLSLGSENGFAEDDTIEPDLFRAIEAAGVTAILSAGNSGHSDYNSEGTGEGLNGYGNLTDNPEMSMVGSPAVYESNIAVASINNTIVYSVKMQIGDTLASFSDRGPIYWESTFAGVEDLKVYSVGGLGTPEDYEASAFADGAVGIALVQRGEIAFGEKVENAQAYDGILGVIIYDNVEGALINMDFTGYNITIPAITISLADGLDIVAAVEAGEEVTVGGIVDGIFDWDSDDGWQGVGGELTYFSSWGAGPGLELKPDITAPGGNIWSSVFRNGYDMMSGTSMAAPHMSGLSALVAQYVKQDLGLTGNAASTLAEHLLVSTAVPQYDEAYYSFNSPRQQGAGLADVAAALSTPAYITVDDENVGKLELLDSADGHFDYSFNVVNISDEEVSYDATIYFQIPSAYPLTAEYDMFYMTNADDLIAYDDLGTITVPANGTVSYSGSIDAAEMIEEAMEYFFGLGMDDVFPNGTYIEGFIILEDAAGENPEISLPYLGFVGDWTQAPIFDSATWYNFLDENGYPTQAYYDYFWGITYLGSTYGDTYLFLPGENVYYGDYQPTYLMENFTLSPNGDGLFDAIDYYEIYQLRDARIIVMEVRDKATGEIYYKDWFSCMAKTSYSTDYGFVFPYSLYFSGGWDGTDMYGDVLPSGTEVEYTLTAYNEGDYVWDYDPDYGWYADGFAIDPTDPTTEPTFNGHPMNKTGDVISFDILIDTEAPELVNEEIIVESFPEYGTFVVEGTFDDGNGSIAWVEAYPVLVDEDGYPEIDYDWMFLADPVFDADVHNYTFDIVDLFDYANPDWEGYIVIFCGDYGANENGYIFNIYDEIDAPIIDPDEEETDKGVFDEEGRLFIELGGEDSLLVDVYPLGYPVEWSSSDESVVEVDEYGNISAVGTGSAIITVFDPYSDEYVEFVVVVYYTAAGETTVGGIAVEGDKNTVNLTTGQVDELVAVIDLGDFELNDFVWVSGNTGIVTVDQDGVITAVSAGTTTVKVYSQSHPEIYVEFTVVVTDPPYVPPVEEPSAPQQQHRHIFSNWLFNENSHWRLCVTCGIMIDVGNHNLVDGTCVYCGYTAVAPDTAGSENVPDDGEGEIVIEPPTEGIDGDEDADDAAELEVNDTPVTDSNPHTGVAFSAFALAIAAAAAVSSKKR